MERLLEMLGVLAVLYAAYALGMKKWDYASETAREKRKTELKLAGVSNTFYFIHARTLLLLNLLSGGLFTFYWIYKQWQAVLQGFRRLEGGPLAHGPFLRALGGAVTFFTLGGIINRTCEYMRRKPAMPAGVWGCLWLGGLIAAAAPAEWTLRAAGYLLFCSAPAAFQNRLNALPKTPISTAPKPAEIIAAALALLCALGIIAALRIIYHA